LCRQFFKAEHALFFFGNRYSNLEIGSERIHHLPEALNHRMLAVVPELAGVEEGAETARARLIFDMKLVLINHRYHLYITLGAVDLPHVIVFLADVFIPDIDTVGSLYPRKILLFQDVEPDALAIGATVHLDLLVGDGFKTGIAFGALHGRFSHQARVAESILGSIVCRYRTCYEKGLIGSESPKINPDYTIVDTGSMRIRPVFVKLRPCSRPRIHSKETPMTFRNRAGTYVALLLLTLFTACDSGQPQSTDQAEQPAAGEAPRAGDMPPGTPPAGQAVQPGMLPVPVVTEGGTLTWTKPSDWIDEPPANSMRRAQYRVSGTAGDALCVVYYFGAGQGGGPLVNAERWADQFDQPDGSSSRAALKTEEIAVNGMPTLMVEIAGTYKEGGMRMTGAPEQQKPGYMLQAAIVQGPDANWFFKFTGPEETVKANVGQFESLVKSAEGPS
jgi:hypothetical protein